MKVSVVILNFNGEDLLQQFLPSVVKHSHSEDVEVFVVDNCSTDNSLQILEQYPEVKLIALPENYGFAKGYNVALQQIDAKYVVLLNSDVEVSENWLQPMIELLETNEEIAACQPKILSFKDSRYFEYAGACGGFIDRYGYPFCRGRLSKTTEKDCGQYDNSIPVFWASGACFCIRLSDFKQCGGFDERFFAHMEEIDLCWRLQLLGKQLFCCPQSVVKHVGAATLQNNSRKLYLNFRNNLLMLYKNLPLRQMKRVFAMRWFLDYLAMFQFLLKGEMSNAKAVFRARKDFSAMRKEYGAVRAFVQKNALDKSIKTIYPHSILLETYLWRKKSFNDLKF